jgi:hypothetical protein
MGIRFASVQRWVIALIFLSSASTSGFIFFIFRPSIRTSLGD